MWKYSFKKNWTRLENVPRILDSETVPEYANRLGYSFEPDFVLCKQNSILGIFQKDEEFLIHFEVDDFRAIICVEDLPSLLEIIEKFQMLMIGHLEMMCLIDEES